MPSLCQTEWETSSQEKENECQMLEEEEATDEGDGGGEEKADSKTDEGDGGGEERETGLGGGAASPSLPTPIEVFWAANGPGELDVWAPKPLEKQIAFLASLAMERDAYLKKNNIRAEDSGLICPYWVNWMLTQMKKSFENTDSQQEKYIKIES